MAPLTRNTARTYSVSPAEFSKHPVAAGVRIFEGMALETETAGTPDSVKPLLLAGVFVGFAVREADNTNTIGAVVQVRSRGEVNLDIVGLTADTAISTAVYAADDGTFTLTATSNTQIGKLLRYVAGTRGICAFEATAKRSV